MCSLSSRRFLEPTLKSSSIFLFRSAFEKIQLSKKIAEEFVLEFMPGFYIKTVSGDGSCIISSFVEALKALGLNVTFQSVLSSLRHELEKDKYQEACEEGTIVAEQFEKYVKD